MPQRLHLVFGGELGDPERSEFRDEEREAPSTEELG